MAEVAVEETLLKDGTLSFSVETRVLRELGERLVKQPEVAIVELIKNAFDADATKCAVEYSGRGRIIVEDDGSGMTLSRFTNAWMRIGTGSKANSPLSERFKREITGEKGIGRFAVRFLGRALRLESVAEDGERKLKTKLTANFDWPRFDRNEDLGTVKVPYRLVEAARGAQTGTKLTITRLRPQAGRLDLQAVRTGSIGVLTPLRSLFRQALGEEILGGEAADPGFALNLVSGRDTAGTDVADGILEGFVLRAVLKVSDDEIDLRIYRRGRKEPQLQIVDTYVNEVGGIKADIRFFPRRKGTFTGLPVDGRRAQTWVKDNHGVAVFDRMFRVQPYGSPRDDWLRLQADAARNHREPRSSLAGKHFPMSQAEKVDTRQNWMLRLPQSMQLVGLVCVNGRRASELEDGEGLIASADREGFVENKAFGELWDLVRGAVEAIAFSDRKLQQEEDAHERAKLLQAARDQTKAAIEEIETNPHIAEGDRTRIVSALAQSQKLAEQQGEEYREREQRLEVMSLLGVVAGFMTHEFGIALAELESTKESLDVLAKKRPVYGGTAKEFAEHIRQLEEFVNYSSGYIRGSRSVPKDSYLARPRIRQVKRVFGGYAAKRRIDVDMAGVDSRLSAPLVPVSLYNGLALNLFTNALKAVTAKTGNARGKIAFRAWNDERWHYLEVSDTGIGIPSVLRERVFDPLFTTTASQNDPLGSGMGLGLTLVRRGAEAFGGKATVEVPEDGFATTVRVRLPLRLGGTER